MSTIPTSSSYANNQAAASSSSTAQSSTEGTKQAGSSSTSIAMQVKAESNRAILTASMQVSISAGDNSQQLVFRAAIDKINQQLEPTLGKDALQGAASQDNSPSATATRIVSMSTGLFAAYAAQHKGDDPQTQAKNFIDLVRKGVDQGFKEGRDILKSLNVLQGDIASNIDKTYELVQKGLNDFLTSQGVKVDATSGSSSTSSSSSQQNGTAS